ncbi:putative pentatricopeptide [Medicago truncatula]|uniref:Putative pentatricopeptide n=1 Tax=Medicago truncatula TaxID=3880 RepID=A0A396JFN7_MEDTR|nr:putative pentatricopeptide [Medicago truncatula]
MIHGMVSKDRFNDAVHLYASMHKAAIVPDSFTFSFVLKACARLNLFHLGMMMHSLVFKTGFDCDVFVKTNVVCFYSKCGFLKDAWKMFDDMVVKNIVSWTGMICGCIEFGKFREAVYLFRGLLESGLRPDGFVIVRVLRACARLGDLDSGRWIDRCLRDCGLSRNVFVATSLVDMYTKCGSMEEARFGYASNGLPREAIELFFEMRKVNVRPDCYAMMGALSSCVIDFWQVYQILSK